MTCSLQDRLKLYLTIIPDKCYHSCTICSEHSLNVGTSKPPKLCLPIQKLGLRRLGSRTLLSQLPSTVETQKHFSGLMGPPRALRPPTADGARSWRTCCCMRPDQLSCEPCTLFVWLMLQSSAAVSSPADGQLVHVGGMSGHGRAVSAVALQVLPLHAALCRWVHLGLGWFVP